MSEWTWDLIQGDEHFETWRMKVPSGWLVRTGESGIHSKTSTCIFVAEKE